jgi:hypothetical protein
MNGYQFVRIGEEGQSKIYSSWNDFSQLAVGGLLCRNVIVKSLSPIYNLFPVHHSLSFVAIIVAGNGRRSSVIGSWVPRY